MYYPKLKHSAATLAILVSTALVGCSDSDDKPTPAPAPVTQDYVVTVTNLTANQPLSPITVVAHGTDTPIWVTGNPSSLALETLAESGDNSGLAAEVGVTKVMSGAAPLPPGMTESIEISLTEEQVAGLTVVTMLVNTNDAFTGIGNYALSHIASGDYVKLRSIAYDAGTEANSEAKGTIPGPADGGEGFNATRDDVDRVHGHPGVISADDGLTDSVLAASHRFDNPVMSVTIARSN